ncbi:hypothetical protein [Nitrospira sp. BLG_1]|uniref:hypothetical protein n=1 Tax=Nitrospira sp. BLG_1 TaxID=3395883 RepID=UPI0039BC7D41
MEIVGFQASRVMRDENFGFKQQRWVLDALMYSPGILKVCQEWRRIANGDGSYVEALRTAVSNVDWSDWVYDTAATSVHDAEFTGSRVRMSVDEALANPMFAHVKPDVIRGMVSNEIADDSRLFFENDDKMQPYRDRITLWEVWDRCENKIKVFSADGNDTLLYDEPWEGHDNGPYHYLDFLDVPNHVVGLSPLCLLHNLIEATNRSLSKVIKQTDAAKTIMKIRGGNRSEAEAVMNALDGTSVYEEGGGTSEIFSIGGPDNKTLMMVPMLKDLYNWLGGNINELAGLGVSAPTAHQGELLAKAASGMVSFMQARTNEAVRLACESIVHNELADPIGTEVMPYKMADGQTYWQKLTPEMRLQLSKELLNVDIDVYSMGYKSPEQRLQSVMQWWNSFAMPSYQMLSAQGGQYDIQSLNRAIADMMDEPLINEVTIYSDKPNPEMTGGAAMPIRQSPNTTRTHIRQDRGNDNADSKMMASISSMGDSDG